MVQNARQPKDLSYVYDLTLTLMTYGANPNVSIDDPSNCMEDCDLPSNEPPSPPLRPRSVYPVSPRNLVLYHYVQLLMRKDQLWINDPDQYFARIIRLYYLVMKHAEVYACLRVLYAQTGMTPTKTALCSVIRDLYSKPRTLKQLCRVVIYNSIRQRPAFNANKLPLPPSLRDYLLNFEP
jgi:hypothetical protein